MKSVAMPVNLLPVILLRCAALSLLATGGVAPAQLQLPDLSGGQSANGPSTGSGLDRGLGGGLAGGLGGVLGGLMPDIASVAAPNAAGVLGYCLKNRFLGAGGAASVLGQLTGKPGTKTAPGYAAGQKGVLQLEGASLPLDGLKGRAATKLCDLVLKRAQAFL